MKTKNLAVALGVDVLNVRTRSPGEEWPKVEIGELIHGVEQGWSPQCEKEAAISFDDWAVMKTTAVQALKFLQNENKKLPSQLDPKPTLQLKRNDILLTRAGPRSRVAVSCLVENVRPRLMLCDKAYKFRANESFVQSKYLVYFLNAPETLSTLNGLKTGISESGVNLTQLKFSKLEVPLAPVEEQKRIADKLDTILARADACREHLDRVPILLKRFRQSVLAAATSGELTADWRQQYLATATRNSEAIPSALDELSDYLAHRSLTEKKAPPQADLTYRTPVAPASWIICSVNQFAECLDRLRVPIKRDKRSSSAGLFPYYGANGEVSRIDNFIFDDEIVLVTEDETFYGREKPIAYRSSGKCWVNNHAHVLKPRTRDAADYLCYALMYYDVIPWLSGTTGRAKLTQGALNSLPIAVPPEVEMVEVVRRVKSLFAFAERLEARLAGARAATERLTPAVLSQAFRGQLVPQDPNDEPASELLKRLAASRAADGDKPRRGRAAKI